MKLVGISYQRQQSVIQLIIKQQYLPCYWQDNKVF